MCYDSVKSGIKNHDLGVIQGSKIGPLFFDIHSSDFASMCARDESILYADDSVLLYVGTSLEEFIQHSNNRFRDTLEWCNCNEIKLNTPKSEFMVVIMKSKIFRP